MACIQFILKVLPELAFKLPEKKKKRGGHRQKIDKRARKNAIASRWVKNDNWIVAGHNDFDFDKVK